MTRYSRNQMAARVARDIAEGTYVNLGIGLPTLVAEYLPAEREVILHSENGVLGMGPSPLAGAEDFELINAGKQPITLLQGGCFFHHGDSFAMIRGGHIDLCVLGAFQVSKGGDLANWHTGAPDSIPAVGGAMDLAIGAKRVVVMMDLLTRDGASKLVDQCTYPVTGLNCVSRIYTDVAIFDIGSEDVLVSEIVAGTSLDEIKRMTGLPLRMP
ncbi:MAG TPA: 3-oxoacid CoA-transferase subunit B [Steroidobacteraceae bacterium]